MVHKQFLKTILDSNKYLSQWHVEINLSLILRVMHVHTHSEFYPRPVWPYVILHVVNFIHES